MTLAEWLGQLSPVKKIGTRTRTSTPRLPMSPKQADAATLVDRNG